MTQTNALKHHDFVVAIRVNQANPNGDPADENRPRTNLDGYGEMSQMCIKRKIRNALFHAGHPLFIVSDELVNDNLYSIEERIGGVMKGVSSVQEQKDAMFRNFIDARLFGFVIAIKGKGKKTKAKKKDLPDESAEGTSSEDDAIATCHRRGAVTVTDAISLEPVDICDVQISKSVNMSKTEDNVKGSDTFGHYYKTSGVYVFRGSINKFWGEKNLLTEDDVLEFKKAILRMFDNDISVARPAGSMYVTDAVWWTQDTRSISTHKLHDSVVVTPEGQISLKENSGVFEPEHLKF